MDGLTEIKLYGDNIGRVTLLDVMGDEFTPAEDARTSTGKGRLGPEKDAALQRRLMADNHTSPFEGVLVKFEMVVPLCVLREIDRHRTLDKPADGELGLEIVSSEEGSRKWLARNEMSGRYVQLPPDYFFPEEVRAQSKTNAQGLATSTAVAPDVVDEFIVRGRIVTLAARELYDWAVAQGIEKGQARFFNTQNQYTKIRLTGSLKNWLDFLYLRLPNVVLRECQVVAQAIEELLTARFSSVIEQWRENVYDAVRLSHTEARALRDFLHFGCAATEPGQAEILKGVETKLAMKLGKRS